MTEGTTRDSRVTSPDALLARAPRSALTLAFGALVAVALLSALPAAPADSAPARSPAYRAAAALRVHAPASHSGYSRSQFGDGWTDTDRNSCDTRDDILRRDLRALSMSGACRVMNGTLNDPYTGEQVFFVRGGASEVDIDHVVALSNAWSSGAARWPFGKRVALANDRLNLLAVASSVNRSKGDADAAQWLPPARGYWCAYVARQVAVKRKYGLWVTSAERRRMLQVLSACPRQKLPAPGSLPTVASGVGNGPAVAGGAAAVGPKPGGSGNDPRFSSCKAAIASGYGNYRRGRDPEYAWYRDGDGDGVACERH